jgi:MFS family permease
MFLAGVYPPSMKIMASWFRTGRGTAIGVLIGGLTLGKAFPYLINAFSMENWRQNLLIVSAFAIAGGLIVLLLKDGPYHLPSAPFDISQVGKAFANRGVRLANFGYFGHMWELYAMWTWAPVMIRASFQASGVESSLAEAVSFGAIGAGAIGCVIAGILADRMGRTFIASTAMILSGFCCLTIGLLFGLHPVWLSIVALIWGASVVADSAQFSTCVTELADPRYIGTALTLQTCAGFLITTITIDLIPWILNYTGWRYAFIILAPGPLLGVAAMLRLRSLPEAIKIAHGKR